ncbi:MAG: anthranilate synthase component I family protein [Thermoanaerobaculia bacterium]
MSLAVIGLEGRYDREALLRLLAVEGAAAFEGWSDGAPWRVYLPWPEEVRTLAWDRARDWQSFVADLTPAPVDGARPASPIATGWLGFVSYEAGALTLDAPPRADVPIEPAAWFARHASGVALDPDGRAFLYAGESELEAKLRSLERLSRREPDQSHSGAVIPVDSMPDGAFSSAVDTIREMIGAGDVYQVNLTRSYTAHAAIAPPDLYLRLTRDEPPRCAALLRGHSWAIASASPEVLLRFDAHSGRAESRPIKGTVRRDGEDAREIAWLLASAKDDSEHLMIVDLVRNDLGTIAPPGSVSVARYKSVLEMPYVYHLESTVRATGLNDRSVAEVLGALFPGGSITGAPKRAAVHAIRELEPVPRGVYTGAIGFIDDRGLAEFSVAIRTAVVGPDFVRYHAGGGIVWDSSPAAEDAESHAKAIPFLRAIGGAP